MAVAERHCFDYSRNMEEKTAVAMLAALAQESRLRVFRLLVRSGPGGLAAGSIALELSLPAATLSFHLARLSAAGLIDARREGRSIVYAVRAEGVRGLIGYMTEDCCAGRPELCQPRPSRRGARRK